MLRWRGETSKSVVVSRSRPCANSPAISAGVNVRIQVAANSMARGVPSSIRQMWAMWRASSSVREKSGRKRWMEARNSAAALYSLQIRHMDPRPALLGRHRHAIERRQPLGRHVQPRARCHQQLDLRRRRKNLCHEAVAVTAVRVRSGQQMLIVVQHEQHLLVVQEVKQVLIRLAGGLLRRVQRAQDCRRKILSRCEGREVYEVGAVCESIDFGSSRLEGEASLADTAGADHGQQAARRIGKILCDLCQLVFAADEGSLVGG